MASSDDVDDFWQHYTPISFEISLSVQTIVKTTQGVIFVFVPCLWDLRFEFHLHSTCSKACGLSCLALSFPPMHTHRFTFSAVYCLSHLSFIDQSSSRMWECSHFLNPVSCRETQRSGKRQNYKFTFCTMFNLSNAVILIMNRKRCIVKWDEEKATNKSR